MTETLSTPDGLLALSIKQPWSALVVSGIKSIEVRTWPKAVRGPVLIHTGRTPDPRPEEEEHITTSQPHTFLLPFLHDT
jgi:hypothetical protein